MASKRQYISKAFSFGESPVWQQFSFADIFLDAYVDASSRKALKDPNGFRNTVGSLGVLSKALTQLITNPTLGKYKHHVAQLRLAVDQAVDIMRRLPGPDDPERIVAFLRHIVGKVNALRPGESLIVPAGWIGSQDAHCLLVVLSRKNTTFSLAVSNTSGDDGPRRTAPAARPLSPPPTTTCPASTPA